MRAVQIIPTITALENFSAQTGLSRATLWRYRKKRWIETVNIAGRQYITAEAVEEFKRRASAGEFSAEHKTPGRGVAR